MDDELQQLEAELSRLRPLGISRKLTESISARIMPTHRRIMPNVLWVAFPIAAAVALSFVLRPALRTPPATSPASPVATADVAAREFTPVAAQNVLLNRRDDGFVTLADGTPARRVRESYIDTITWQNPQTKASLQWTMPREEVRIVPIAYQ